MFAAPVKIPGLSFDALRRTALALAASALAACATLPAQVPAPAAEPVRLAPGEWPQARTDIAPDPDIVFGALPNGMRYAIRRQTIPPGQAAIRLRFDAGSLMEEDDQRGLAHFLEHMAFNGSKAVPEGEMVRVLERLGLAFGADTNASTSLEETIYRLDLPRTDAETVDTSLMLMREVASNLLIEPAAVDRERGVVLSEERSRDTPAYRVYKERLAFFLRGQRPPERMPIGDPQVLRSAPAERIADLYRRYYRPERAVLVAVGDFDVAEMEAKIRARFSDWQAQDPAGETPDLGPVARRGLEARLVVETGVQESLQIAWVGPPDHAFDSLAKRKRDVIERLGFSVLNRRFNRIGRSADAPFLGAGAFKGDEYDAAEITLVSVNVKPGRWREALAAVEQEQRRIVRYGVRQEELDREIAEARANLQAAVAGAATRRPSTLAADILSSLRDDYVVTAPAQELEIFEAAVAGLTARQVSDALKAAFTGQGPLIFAVSPTPIEGGEATLLSAFQESRRKSVAPPPAAGPAAWPYTDFGPPGEVVERTEAQDLGATFVRLANGVRLTVKPTPFRDDEVLVRVNVGRGLLSLPKDAPGYGWAASAVIEGGLKQISAEDMEMVLADKVYGARFGVGEDAFAFTGSTRTGHLDTQLQVLTAYLAEPGWRPEAFERVKTAMATVHDRYETTVGGVAARDLGGLLRGEDPRWTFPSRERIASAELDDLKAQVSPALERGDVEVVLVGDLAVDTGIEAVARTFGALPPRPADPERVPDAHREVGFPAPAEEPVARTHKGRADQALGYVAWRTSDFFADPRQARVVAILGEVLRLRLIEELREAQGATYSPSVAYAHSFNLPGWGYISASVEIPPEKLPAFFDDVARIAAELAEKPVSEDELARAKQPRLERLERARLTNEYWLNELSRAQADPRRLEAARTVVEDTRAVTAADVQAAARRFLGARNAWKFVVRPAAE
ncbi:MAG: insulinase family protein [Phenylobacterium sp.]|jgi:zinc protease|uniref:M16 family metallopeptidase n=1 Tax=Phenylobacterium sp. TaxID=1871053 RepID=UPI002A3610C4|nr:insulinase family protein [Phenylobacterium sp.]MDX9997395.1 insulinase family protein [Phenylobacterium sp.]